MSEGNPVHDDVRAVVAAVGRVDFGLDVVLNREQGIVAAFGGELFAMHAAARAASRGWRCSRCRRRSTWW